MNQERKLQIVLGPLVTEKSSLATSQKQVVFKVECNASKKDIKEAVECLLDIEVNAVNTVNVKGKQKRFEQRAGYRAGFKKAYINLDKAVDMEALLSEQQS
ncbi:50S ribosomal protein L23 [uncultured Cardiobacterium sp.]|uniref:50S ribosomal protein L23 n=1 Tax=uncultured Cardiobacterium sp. TaxID=417619 RepID=UPI00260C51CC|nr:50S ribosomal protein L23 [uncultured Cardiobacterium sp.]